MARTGDDLEAADAIARLQEDVRPGLQLWPATRKLALDHVLAGVNPRVELGHHHRDSVAELLLERVERADVVAVTVGERNPSDRSARRPRGGDQAVGGTADRRVDEREAVVLAHQIRVDEPHASELHEVLGYRGALHGHAALL